MPRMTRIESPGSLVHIMAHSVESKPLFVDNQDKLEFLSRFEKGLVNTGYICYTWVLMDNHYHLFLRTSEKKMSKLMRGLNGGYATYYNKRHGKNGYLFQNRFKSILCQDQSYALELIRYINLNPLHAGLIKSLKLLKNYLWCGHGFLLGDSNAMGNTFQKREECLRRFGETELDAVKNYLEFLLKKCGDDNKTADLLSKIEESEIKNSCKGWPSVIGDPAFVNEVKKKHQNILLRFHPKTDYAYVLETISRKVCEKFGISINELKKRGRKNTRADARAVFCYQINIKEYIPLSVIAGFLGTTISPIAVLVQKGANICENVTMQ